MSKNITIHLDNGAILRPGERVSGHVTLNSTEQADVQNVAITFEGRLKTKLVTGGGQNRRVYRARITLFYFRHILFQGPFTLPPGSMKWPFEFTLPYDCANVRGDELDPASGGFDTNRGQQLPPTFAGNHSGLGGSKDCYVTYSLEAKLQATKLFSSNKDSIVFLGVTPWRAELRPEIPTRAFPKSFLIRTLHLDPEIKDRSLSFKESMRSVFKSDTLPRSLFDIKLHVPQAGISGQQIKVLLYLEHKLQGSTATEIPIVYLKSFHVSLKRQINLRFARGVLSFSERETCWTETVPLVNWVGSTALSEAFDVTTLFRNGIRLGVNPTFKTFTITMGYTLVVKYSIECAGKTEKAEHKVYSFSILPVDHPGTESPARQIQTQSQPEPEEEQLPAYSKVDENPPPKE
jgi:hypothetical protein